MHEDAYARTLRTISREEYGIWLDPKDNQIWLVTAFGAIASTPLYPFCELGFLPEEMDGDPTLTEEQERDLQGAVGFARGKTGWRPDPTPGEKLARLLYEGLEKEQWGTIEPDWIRMASDLRDTEDDEYLANSDDSDDPYEREAVESLRRIFASVAAAINIE